MYKILILFSIIFLSAFTPTGLSQDYDTGIGARGGVAWGLTVKHFITTRDAGELLLTVRHNGLNATGLFETHLPVFDTEDFYFFCGGGLHFGLWNTEEPKILKDVKANTGIDIIIGLEYDLEDLPLSIGMDWKPGLNIVSDFGFTIDEIALSIRYVFD